ncbi:hypothetical protein JCM3774_005085 [Rhodotorula dairenensis]
MPYDSPARVQTRRSAAATGAHLNGQQQQQQLAGSDVVVAQRQLGIIGGRSGPGYSPYARRIASRAAQYDRGLVAAPNAHRDRDDLDLDQDQDLDADVPARQSTGLFGKVKSLPGRMLGLLSRSSSRQTLSGSTSLADVRAELDQQLARGSDNDDDTNKKTMPRSRTTLHLAEAAGRGRAPPPPALPASSSLSALSALSSAPARTAHSKLNLPPAGAAPFAQRGGASPSVYSAAATSTHNGTRNRSPSPLRNGLAGSMSSFQLAQPPTLGDSAPVNPFGLQSRSPFTSGTAAAAAAATDSPRRYHQAPASESFYASRTGAGGAGGHPLFPYSSNLPRGTSPALSGSFSMRDGLSTLGGTTSAKRTFASRMAHGGAAAAVASPLGRNHQYLSTSRTVSGGLSDLAGARGGDDDVEMLAGPPSDSGSADRARKRQLVWDPERGLVSRAKLEQEKARNAPPMPKNEAERILEVLEGMGRTPLGEAKRASTRPKHISIPQLAADEEKGSRLSRSSTTPAFLFASTPYAARAPKPLPSPTAATTTGKPEKGLQAVLRAREERRRQLLEQERAERERERLEDEERERERAKRRKDRRRRIEELMSDDDDARDVFSDDTAADDDRATSPRRVTRSSTRGQPAAQTPAKSRSSKGKGKGKDLLEPESDRPTPTTRRSTRASSRATSQQPKSPSPVPPTPARKTRAQTRTRTERAEADAEMGPPAPAAREDEEVEEERPTKRGGAPALRTKSPSPAAVVEKDMAAIAAPKISFPAPSSFPASAPSTSTGRSSLRPGKSHTSRQHTTSSRVFSAKEEDLPPIDDAALAKIQLPAFKVPAGFSFGAPPAAPSASTAPSTSGTTPSSADSSVKITPAAPSASLLSRLGSAPPAASSSASDATAKPAAFSFGTPPAPAASTPAFSFTAAPADKAGDKDTTAAKPAASDFFSKPASTTTPSFSFGASTAAAAAADSGSKPNFFGAVIAADKSKTSAASSSEAPKTTPLFSFGGAPAAAADAVIKPTEVIPPTPSEAALAPTGGNPFAAFGKPVAEIVKEAEASKETGTKAVEPAAKPAPFNFGAPAAVDTAKKDEGGKKDEVRVPPREPVERARLISFTPQLQTPKLPFAIGAPKADAAPSPFAFGASTAKPTEDKDKLAPFSFGAPPAAKPASAPTFTFGTTPATPQAEEKKEPPKALFGTTGALNPPSAPASVTDEAGDSGMEDEAEPTNSTPAFSFGAASSAAPASGAPLFGSAAPSPSFSFGAPSSSTTADKKDASGVPASPFGAPATTSFFGAGATSPTKPAASFSFGGVAPSPSPSPAPPSPAPASGAATPSFTFGAPAAGGPSPFGGFGSAAPAASSAPSFAFGAPTMPSAATSPAPTTAGGFSFGNQASSAMGQTLSTASTTGSVNGGSGFAFGSANGTAAPASSGAAAFTFGAPASASTAVAAAPAANPFAFGAPASQPGTPGAGTPGAGGFTFGAPTGSAPPTPGLAPAAGGGLFNIGSGGGDDSNKGRPIRPLRRTKR